MAAPESIDVDGVAWTRLEHDALPQLRFVGGVTQTNGHFFLTGSRCAYPLPEYAGGCGTSEVLFSSPDGTAWSELGTVATQPDSAWPFYEDESQILAPGSRGSDESSEPGVWRSTDGGLNWDFITDPSFTSGNCVGDSRGYVGDIVTDGSVLIGIGTGIWHSTDGQTWTCIGSTPPIQIIYSHGMFVGDGYTDQSSPAEWFWRSADGIEWQKTQKAPDNTRVVSVSSGFVAVGGSNGHSPPTELLTSPDGQSWAQQPYPFGDADVELTTADSGRAVVIEHGYSNIPGEVEPGPIWVSSSDGATWTRYPLPPRDGDYADSAAILGNEIVVVGSSYNNGNSDGSGVIWSAQIP